MFAFTTWLTASQFLWAEDTMAQKIPEGNVYGMVRRRDSEDAAGVQVQEGQSAVGVQVQEESQKMQQKKLGA